ncbi:MAG: CCA tRNA nucleotidyltransferase [Lachnospiraceae bacterium]|nr:CCA tRNA nucleotidyltransferase [Lachnospiraceae bacterium]
MKLPETVEMILDILRRAGYPAYAVGGCVRDTILCREPNDWDITTSARPEEVKKCFRRTVDTGIAHGTVTVMIRKKGYEVTTFRIDGQYGDARHPDNVVFTSDLREDLLRRDFTINAMAYSHESGLVDPFGGQEDLRKKIVRAVGVPVERFTEDALRVLRCVRFAAQLGFSIDPKTYDAAKELSRNLEKISAERIREEFLKILLSAHPDYTAKLQEIGAMPFIYPSYREIQNEAERALLLAPADKVLRLTAFLYQGGVKDAEAFFDRLKFDNDTRNRVLHLIRHKDAALEAEPKSLRKFLSVFGKEDVDKILLFHEKILGTDLTEVRRELKGIEARGECTSLKELALTGNDLTAMGMKPGREMGALLHELLEAVIEDPKLNTKEKLKKIAEGRLQG